MKQSKLPLVQSSSHWQGVGPEQGWSRLDHGSSAVLWDIRDRTWDTVWQPWVLLLPLREQAVTVKGNEEFLNGRLFCFKADYFVLMERSLKR